MRVLPAAPASRRSLSDAGSVALALAVVAGAIVSRPLPLALGAAAGVVALVARRPVLLMMAAALVASALGARAIAGLHPVAAAQVHQVVTLLSDPSPTRGGVRALVRIDGRRVEVRASASAVGAISVSLAGEQVDVEGRLRPPPPDDEWLRVQHVVGVLSASRAERSGAGTAPWRAANRVRRLLERGAQSLPPGPRSLFSGFVLGDDREEPAAVADDFRATGLTHLLAVSGENLAFVLALLGPALRRCGLRSRWVITVAAIAFFALITRGEPSVLRAAVMATMAVSARSLGRQVSPLRLLALAVSALVLVDPFLVDSTGFRLSVGASLGIVLLAPTLGRSLPGPRAFAEGLAVTVAAQVGVAPVLLASFGGLPVAALPANLLAVPVAGLVMVWGVSAGLVAGMVGGPVAAALHLPTRLLIAWISGVAERAARWPLGTMGLREVALLTAGVLLVVAGVRVGRRWAERTGYVVAAIALVLPPLALRWARPPPQARPVAGVTVWRAGRTTIVELAASAAPVQVLGALRETGVRRVDLLLLRSPSKNSGALTAALQHRWPVGDVLEAAGANVPGASIPVTGELRTVGPFTVAITAARPQLRVRVRVRRAPSRSSATRTQIGSPGAARARSPPPRCHLPIRGGRHPEPHAGLLL